MFLNGQHRINETLNLLGPVLNLIPGNPFCGGDMLSTILRLEREKRALFLKKIAVGEHVGNDKLVLDEGVAVEQKGVAGIGVNDKLVNFA